MSDFAVELREVTKKFTSPEGNPVLAVDNVTLHIRDGEFFSLLGPSGCGKTTSLRLIAGFEQPTTGAVVIASQVMGMTPPFQRPVNTVFQSYALFPHMTVAQNVAFGLEMKHAPKDEIRRRVTESLAMVRLPGMEKRYPKQLSGGQQQRVALARALINRPHVLLLDEPLGALDLKLRKEMQLELKTLQREVSITFVYVTHDQEEALTMSDRIAVMNAGKALQVGTPTDIYERPNSRFVADFIGETNFLPGTIVACEGKSATVDCGGLQVVAEIERALAPGTQATVAVRPEKIRLVLECPPGVPNCFRARIANVVYVGTDTHFDLRLTTPIHFYQGLLTSNETSEIRLRVRQQNLIPTFDPSAYSASAEVYAVWLPESARVLVE
jgi:spermidine/putrescine transport system ATP-binding protein